jgi:hypothetical protein
MFVLNKDSNHLKRIVNAIGFEGFKFHMRPLAAGAAQFGEQTGVPLVSLYFTLAEPVALRVFALSATLQQPAPVLFVIGTQFTGRGMFGALG